LDQINRISPTARTAVDALVQVISLVRAPQSKKGTQSFSNKPVIGRMGIANADSDRWSISKIADAIVHETIHALIYKIELTNCLYLDDSIESEPLKIKSPWSGRQLPLHSFVHACFVWFGLWSFWRLAPAGEPEAAKLKGRAAQGFLSGNPLSCIPDEALERIRPEVRHAIDRMFKEVTASVNNTATAVPIDSTATTNHHQSL
jgi:HEXXH motif-containing protein